MSNNRLRSKGKRKDISLMTLLANESTADSRKLLKKYKQPDAVDYDDLETKLANLYFGTDDKVQIEKELAEIHPHKKWLLRNTEPVVEIKKEEVVIEAKPEKKEETSNFNGGMGCNPNCPYCQAMMAQRLASGFSNANGQEGSFTKPTDYVGVIGMVAVVGALFYVLSKNK
jgi:hypothetical protein